MTTYSIYDEQMDARGERLIYLNTVEADSPEEAVNVSDYTDKGEEYVVIADSNFNTAEKTRENGVINARLVHVGYVADREPEPEEIVKEEAIFTWAAEETGEGVIGTKLLHVGYTDEREVEYDEIERNGKIYTWAGE